MPSPDAPEPIALTPIGIVRSRFVEKRQAPRQGSVATDIVATIELRPDLEHATRDLDGFERIWVVFWFHEAGGFKPTVQPPRSSKKRGVFATRSPHRPNAIGLSSVRLLDVEGRLVRVTECDLLDATPVLDIKPYVPYADAFPRARAGWIDEEGAPPIDPERLVDAEDPIGAHEVRVGAAAAPMLAWLGDHGRALRADLEAQLSLGAAPHPYRRIRKRGASYTIAVKAWRASFSVSGRTITIERIYSGYRPRELATGTFADAELHRAFASRFGAPP